MRQFCFVLIFFSAATGFSQYEPAKITESDRIEGARFAEMRKHIYPSPSLHLLERERVVEELGLSEKQLERLRDIKPKRPVDVLKEIRGNTNPGWFGELKFGEKEFAAFMKSYKDGNDKAFSEREASIDKILTRRQSKRLKQLHCQYLLMVMEQPRSAMKIYGIDLSDDDLAVYDKCVEEANAGPLAVFKNTVGLSLRYEAIKKAIGRQKVERVGGELFVPDTDPGGRN